MQKYFRNPGLGPLLTITLVTALLFGLGVWQLHRLEWKTALLANIEKAQSEPPEDLLSIPPDALQKDEWHNVIVTGKLLNDKELYALPRYLHEQMGYGILTPLAVGTPTGTRYVLVNRGWVPSARKDPAARAGGNVNAPVTVEGVIRINVERGWLWRQFFSNLPEKNIWLWYDLPAMQKKLNLRLMPVVIDATRVRLATGAPLKDGPTPFPLEIKIRNDHLGYAITWFLIGISGLVIFALYYRQENVDVPRQEAESS
jgi:surfeit locus 1 family protein